MSVSAVSPCGVTLADLAVLDRFAFEAVGAQGTLPVRLYVPRGQPSGLIVFFPPGGFVEDTLDLLEPFAQALAVRNNCCVLAARYTLAGEAPFPAAAEDAYALLQWTAGARDALHWQNGPLLVAGIEAGGNLAAVVGLMCRDRGGVALAGQILITPMLDAELSSCSMRALAIEGNGIGIANACAAGYRQYLPNAADRIHPYASPLQSSRLKGLARCLILSAQDDALRDEAERYATHLREQDVPTTLVRLPPLGIADPSARCDGVRVEGTLAAIHTFFQAID